MYLYTPPQCRIISGTARASINAYALRTAYQAGYTPSSRTIARQKACCPYQHLVVVEQQHGTDGICISHTDDPASYPPYRYTGDYIVTNHPQVACGIATADCAPLILFSRSQPALAAVHAGWRGLAGGVISNAARVLCDLADVSTHDISAYIGPCARSCCYRVDTTTHAHLAGATPSTTWYQTHDGAYYVDILACALLQLTTIGVERQHIHTPGDCTICTPTLCSYRRDQSQDRHLTYGVI